MQYKYSGENWLNGDKAFAFEGLFDYIQQTKKRLSQPLAIPEYATAQEAERIKKISEKIQADPYFQREAYAEMAKNMGYSSLRTVVYGEYPALYEVCIFASRKLTGVNPVIYLYTSQNPGSAYNAAASDYMDRVWIYISDQLVKERGMMKDEELCFLVGHELGHAQCHHITIASSGKDSSDDEYSADRAGMLACTKWIMEKNPDMDAPDAIKEALLYSVSALHKIRIGMANGLNNTYWEKYSYDDVRSLIDGVFKGASRLALTKTSHPLPSHRIMAMVNFSESELMYRCLGLDPEKYQHLTTDVQLSRAMSHLLKDN